MSACFDDEAVAPEGDQLECDGCGCWGDRECYSEYAGKGPDDAPQSHRFYCFQCTGAWRGGERGDAAWSFS